MRDAIVSRHKAATQWLHKHYPESLEANVTEVITAEEARGRVLWGIVPLNIAALAKEVRAIQFPYFPPRGKEYTMEDMEEAGATLVSYRVRIAPKTAARAAFDLRSSIIEVEEWTGETAGTQAASDAHEQIVCEIADGGPGSA